MSNESRVASSESLPRPDMFLFDVGGTLLLIDPARFNAFIAAWNLPAVASDRLSDAHFLTMSDHADRLAAGEHLEDGWWDRRFFDAAGLALSADMAEAFAGGASIWNYPIAGALEAVRDLKSRGYRVAVVSNADGTVAEALDVGGFGGEFEVVIDSGKVGVSKPDPAIFEIALRRLGVAADKSWYVGDSHFYDMGGARAAGLENSVLIDPLGLGPERQLSVRSISSLPDLVR